MMSAAWGGGCDEWQPRSGTCTDPPPRKCPPNKGGEKGLHRENGATSTGQRCYFGGRFSNSAIFSGCRSGTFFSQPDLAPWGEGP